MNQSNSGFVLPISSYSKFYLAIKTLISAILTEAMIEEVIKAIVGNSFFVKYGLIGLFLNSMFSSFIPIPTELTTSALLLSGESQMSVFIVLTIGSIVGGFIAYYIGYDGNKIFNWLRKIQKKHHEKSLSLLRKYGWLIIFLSPWIPVLGDVISIIAGVKKYDIKKYAIVMTVGKTIKAIAIVFVSGLFFH